MTNGTPTRAESGRATLMVALSACGFAAIAIFVTIAIGTGAPLLNLLSWRYLLATVVLGGIASASGRLRLNGAALRVAAFAGLGQAVIAVVTLSALAYIPAATLSFLFFTFPAWVAIIARVRHSEPLTPARLFALALSLTGIFVMVGAPGGTSLHPMGVTLALVGAVIYAAYIPMIASLQRGLSPVATAAYLSAGAAVLLTALAAARGEFTVEMHVTAWYSILALSVLSTVGAFLLFLSGLRVLGAVRTAIVSAIEPFFTALLSAWFLSQPLTRATLLGGALIAGAVVLLQWRPSDDGSGRPS